ncbi:Glycosyltransferase [Halapricum desulfuricans]|uniref:Glycosyltransferase n=1 Tax=Halapricum desulfuricans TaxID=2841257 RepID=A0A897NGB2_9EURY|nr:Glycosyltransferase [Halapricum desulfuricans]QSG10485.1 Glycosyltransferase [Halapricum desulfuricans]
MAAYESHIDEQQRREIHAVAEEHADTRMGHINSTASGGGVAEILVSVVPLLNDVGVDTDWQVMDADDEFFEVTKTIHNGLQGGQTELTEDMRETYRSVTIENAEALDERYDVLVLHDPQTLGMAPTLAERFPETALVWRCHIDLTDATPAYLEFVQSYLDPIDRAVFTLPEYGEAITGVEIDTIYPSIDPLTEKNRPIEELSGDAAEAADLERFPFDTDRPLIVQVSRFDPWKDPLGVIEAYRDVSASIPDAQLALVGAMPDDDPEGVEVYREVEAEAGDDPDIHLLTNLPDAGINGLQWGADLVLQKSLREGFALTVSEALWKETPVVGANVGGIPLQIEDGENGYLIEPRDIESTADRVVRLLEDDQLRRRLGENGRETVREQFLTPRQVLDYLTLLSAAEGDRAE